MIAPLHAAQVHHAVHHRDFDILALPGAIGLMQRTQQTDGQMQSRARIADLRAGHKRRTVGHPGGAHRAAHRLRHVLVGLEIRIRTAGTEALDRTHDDFGIDLVDFFPREAEAIQHAGPEVFHDDVALHQEINENFFTFRVFHVHRDRPLVAIEHGEIKTVGVRHVAQLAARGVALRRFELDHVRAHPRQQLRARRARLHVGHVENTNTF